MADAKFSAVFFDLDGTLVDSETLASEATDRAFREVLKRPISSEENAKLKGRPVKKLLSEWFPNEGEEIYNTIISHFSRRMDEIMPFSGIVDLLDVLEKAGIPMAVVTSGQREVAEKLIHPSGISKYFKFLVCQEDTLKHKPDPEPVLLAAQKLGVRPEACLYIGDQPYDVISARSADMNVLGAVWGPGKLSVLKEEKPTGIVTNPRNVLDYVFKSS